MSSNQEGVMHTGDHVKTVREAARISRNELAEAIGEAPELLSGMEERGEECSVSVLLKIASALGTDISTLIYGKAFDAKSVMVTDRENRVKVERRKQFDYESLAPSYAGKHIEPFLVEVYQTPADKMEYSSHEGEEFHYVMEGTLKTVVGEEEYILDTGDSIYFDSSLPHALTSVGKQAKVMAVVYNATSMRHLTRSKKMTELIEAARHLGGRSVVLVIPNETAIEALNRAMEESVVKHAFLVGDPSAFPQEYQRYADRYEIVEVPGREAGGSDETAWERTCADRGVQLIREGRGHMLMKGNINTAIFMKGVLDREKGIGSGRRLSLVSIFELPKLNRLIFLTDPGINPALSSGKDLDTSRDIILNGIDVARALGVARPRVAILDANEMASEKIPTSMVAQELTRMEWPGAIVHGPLSYDLALYEDAAEHKGITDNPVAGKADILIVPHISGGNFLYKAWAMTMSADVANVVLGAKVPLIITSRSDDDMTKFLTICASAVYSGYTSG
jgi:phosphate butyryltransferase